MKETTSSILQRTCCKCSQHNQKRNALQIEKKHLQIKKTLSSIWQPTRCKCSQHNQKRNVLQIKCIWLYCEHLQCVSLFVCVVNICPICCQNENVFLICWCFFYLHVFFWSCILHMQIHMYLIVSTHPKLKVHFKFWSGRNKCTTLWREGSCARRNAAIILRSQKKHYINLV